jgi:hypothetical protein
VTATRVTTIQPDQTATASKAQPLPRRIAFRPGADACCGLASEVTDSPYEIRIPQPIFDSQFGFQDKQIEIKANRLLRFIAQAETTLKRRPTTGRNARRESFDWHEFADRESTGQQKSGKFSDAAHALAQRAPGFL